MGAGKDDLTSQSADWGSISYTGRLRAKEVAFYQAGVIYW